jgi:uncharacterized NAD(P)/FAD-binding protein YdhS
MDNASINTSGKNDSGISVKPESLFDVAFIGAGISTTYSILHFIEQLEGQPPFKPVNIAVFDKSGEFWTGIPYGTRSGRSALIITPLNEFLPVPERAKFIEWLTLNWRKIAEADDSVGPLTAKWREANKVAIETGDWNAVFVPRYTFGMYLQSRITAVLQRAVAEGLVTYTLKAHEVLSVTRTKDGAFTLELAPEAPGSSASVPNSTVWANKLVLALGSPPVRQIVTPDPGCLYIRDMYEPSYDTNMHRILEIFSHAKESKPVDLLILGSNASALEVVYTLLDHKAMVGRAGNLLVLSAGGSFPHRINTSPAPMEYSPEHLIALRASASFLSSDILAAVKQDVDHAINSNIPVADIFPIISEGVISALDELQIEEQHKFVSKIGIEIGKLQRRAGGEYLDAVDQLKHEKRFEMIHGAFKSFKMISGNEIEVEYISGSDGESATLRRPIGVIVNCTGFQGISGTPSPIIQSLLANGICTPTESDRGFRVNEHFEASENCFLIGPLIAGNCNNALRIWHAESCIRIIGIAGQLADELCKRVEKQKHRVSEPMAA